MRFFIALEIPSENILDFQSIQTNLHTLIPQAKITSLGKIHLTLAFLGEQPDQFKDSLIKVMENAVKDMPQFEVTPAYIDGFPNLHHPQILWVGVKGDIDKVLKIRERLKDQLEILNLPVDERRFIPHITIAKFNNPIKVDQDLEVSLEKIMAQSFNPIKISSIKLFESIPSGGFHKHNTLAEVKLI